MSRAIEQRDLLTGTPSIARTEAGRWISWAAFVYVVAWVLGLAIGFGTGAPGPLDSPQTITTYYSQHRQLAMLQAYLVDGVAGIALVVFGAGLWSAFSPLEGERRPGASVVLGMAIVAGAVSLVQGLFTQVLADHLAASGDATVIRTLYDLNTEGDTYKLLAVGVFLVAVALFIFRTHALPVWLAWLAVVLGPLLMVAGWTFLVPEGAQYVAYAILLVVLLVWVAAVGVVCSDLRPAAGQRSDVQR